MKIITSVLFGLKTVEKENESIVDKNGFAIYRARKYNYNDDTYIELDYYNILFTGIHLDVINGLSLSRAKQVLREIVKTGIDGTQMNPTEDERFELKKIWYANQQYRKII